MSKQAKNDDSRMINIGVPQETHHAMKSYARATGIKVRQLAVLGWKAFNQLAPDQKARLIECGAPGDRRSRQPQHSS